MVAGSSAAAAVLPALLALLAASPPAAAIQNVQSRLSAAAAGTVGASGGLEANVKSFENVESVDGAASAGTAADEDKPLLDVPTEEGKMEAMGCIWGPKAHTVLTDVADFKWKDALEEEGMDANDVSLYGCCVPKMPMSLVRRVQALNHTKIHDYNFQGTYMWEYYRETLPEPLWAAMTWAFPGALSTKKGDPQSKARDWVMDFAKSNFTDKDLFKVVDADGNYQKIGPFDVSEPGKYHDIRNTWLHTGDLGTGEKYKAYIAQFDPLYWEGMTASKFTLCPGGDNNWSMRLYEAILSRSIPVIASSRTDVGFVNLWALWDIPYKYYNLETDKELVYREDWVEENLRLFLKYQTFHEGDNVPPHVFNMTLRLLENANKVALNPGEGAFFGNGAQAPETSADMPAEAPEGKLALVAEEPAALAAQAMVASEASVKTPATPAEAMAAVAADEASAPSAAASVVSRAEVEKLDTPAEPAVSEVPAELLAEHAAQAPELADSPKDSREEPTLLAKLLAENPAQAPELKEESPAELGAEAEDPRAGVAGDAVVMEETSESVSTPEASREATK